VLTNVVGPMREKEKEEESWAGWAAEAGISDFQAERREEGIELRKLIFEIESKFLSSNQIGLNISKPNFELVSK
jgi:hypothetical protein